MAPVAIDGVEGPGPELAMEARRRLGVVGAVEAATVLFEPPGASAVRGAEEDADDDYEDRADRRLQKLQRRAPRSLGPRRQKRQ